MNEFQCNKCHCADFAILANQGEMICRSCGKHFDIFVTQLQLPAITKNELRERLAELEHEQWIHWTQFMLDNMSPEKVAHWRGLINGSYESLTEKQKDIDREWADKTLSIVSQCVLELGGDECPLPKRKNESKSRFRKRR